MVGTSWPNRPCIAFMRCFGCNTFVGFNRQTPGSDARGLRAMASGCTVGWLGSLLVLPGFLKSLSSRTPGFTKGFKLLGTGEKYGKIMNLFIWIFDNYQRTNTQTRHMGLPGRTAFKTARGKLVLACLRRQSYRSPMGRVWDKCSSWPNRGLRP